MWGVMWNLHVLFVGAVGRRPHRRFDRRQPLLGEVLTHRQPCSGRRSSSPRLRPSPWPLPPGPPLRLPKPALMARRRSSVSTQLAGACRAGLPGLALQPEALVAALAALRRGAAHVDDVLEAGTASPADVTAHAVPLDARLYVALVSFTLGDDRATPRGGPKAPARWPQATRVVRSSVGNLAALRRLCRRESEGELRSISGAAGVLRLTYCRRHWPVRATLSPPPRQAWGTAPFSARMPDLLLVGRCGPSRWSRELSGAFGRLLPRLPRLSVRRRLFQRSMPGRLGAASKGLGALLPNTRWHGVPSWGRACRRRRRERWQMCVAPRCATGSLPVLSILPRQEEEVR